MQTFAQEDNSWFIAGGRESLPLDLPPIPPKEGESLPRSIVFSPLRFPHRGTETFKGGEKPTPTLPKGGSASLRANTGLIIKFKVQWSKFNGQRSNFNA